MSEYTPEQLEAALQNVRNELNQGHMQEIMKSIQEKCFNLCISSPGASLSNKDKTCLSNCSDRYIDTMQEVSKAIAK
ncbi:mitochondrial intermembrane space complex subunit Tim13 [Blastocystis sp. ATCC 50177/Nand II]|uniref:Mitochondrial import inner membrane translocase subunit n=1 Tax=Blastocystis sp. subtype 1 (strain ATCC 50177 / NandII) TaxID=478820 RepID=A0A196SJ18_BLAHN|nr:mitochondrial intermembrane space complex subunit Tim13 [Blastocystis sp. ATCC 50177/Nand II]